MQNNNFNISENNILHYILKENKDIIKSDLKKTIEKIIPYIENNKPKEISKSEAILYGLLAIGNAEKEKKYAEEHIKYRNQINSIDKKINSLKNLLNNLNTLDTELSNNDDLVLFNISVLKYNFDFSQKQYQCNKLTLIYDKNSTKEIIQSINIIFSLDEQIKNLNQSIAELYSANINNNIHQIKISNFEKYLSLYRIQSTSDQLFREKYNITLDSELNILLSNESIQPIMVLQLYYFYAHKINQLYGERILAHINITNQQEKNIIQTKIIFDITTIFFQKCLEFYFNKKEELFVEYKKLIQTEVNLLFEKEFEISKNINFDNKEIYEINNSFISQYLDAIKSKENKKNHTENIYPNYINSENIYNNDNEFKIDGSVKNININIQRKAKQTENISNIFTNPIITIQNAFNNLTNKN
jgi:hypothetical protein